LHVSPKLGTSEESVWTGRAPIVCTGTEATEKGAKVDGFERQCTPGPYTSGWFNLECYRAWELPFFFVGCTIWAITYVVIIRNSFKYKFVEMPAIAGAADIAWEFVWSFLLATNMGKFAEYTYKVWFITDIAIFVALWTWGHKQGWAPSIARYFRPMFATAIVFLGIYFFTYSSNGRTDHHIGAITAYADNVMISVTYLFQLARLKDVRGMSPLVSWLKMVGTGLNTIFMILVFPNDPFLISMGVSLWALDMLYIAWLRRRRAAQAAGIEGVPRLDDLSPVAVQ
jgi:hypothetical protein